MNFKNKINLQMNNNLNRGQTRSYLNTKSVPSKSNLNRSISFDEKRKKNGRRKERLLQQKHAAVNTVCKGVVNKDTLINIILASQNYTGILAATWSSKYNAALMKEQLLPFYGGVEADYDANFSEPTYTGTLDSIKVDQNLIGLGGAYMDSATSNVINIIMAMSTTSTFADFEGVAAGDDTSYAGSVDFLKQRLDLHPDNRAIFLQFNYLGVVTPVKTVYEDFQSSLVGTDYATKTLFRYDDLATGVDRVTLLEGAAAYETAHPGRSYFADMMRHQIRIAGCVEKIDVPA